MSNGRRRAAPRVLLFAAVVAGGAVALSVCSGTDGQSLAQQACVHVHASVDDYVLSTETGTPPATAAHLQVEADQELRAALPLAAAANSDDGSWNSLMTTISEGAIVDEGHLIPALRAQCVVADTNPDVNPQGPGNSGNSGTSGTSGGSATTGRSGGTATTIPQNVNPEPASPAG